MPDIIVLGAGISGLTAAFQLKKAGKEVLVLEDAPIAGGKIESERINGYLLEAGPNSIRIENQETIDLIESVGLRDRMIEANPSSKKRFILRNGKWVKVPSSPTEALTTPLFSLGAKLRLLIEPFISKTTLDDESATSFVTRRLGREVFEYAADPFITGIYAGDPAKLSIKHGFASMWLAEQEHGSLIKGMIRAKKASSGKPKVKRQIVSFPNGLSELTSALRQQLGSSLQLRNEIARIDTLNGSFRVATSDGVFAAPTLVVTVPAYSASTLLAAVTTELSSSLAGIDYPPVAVAYLGYREDQFSTAPEGFGGLIPSCERRKILGVVFSSSNFPRRAPSGHILFTVLMGGAKNDGIREWSEAEILQTAKSEISDLFHPTGTPTFEHTRVSKQAIPQYNVGYSAVLKSIEKAESAQPGLHLLGNYRGGISVGNCIRNATELAKRLV